MKTRTVRLRAIASGIAAVAVVIATAPAAQADTVLAEQGSEDLVAAGGVLYFSQRRPTGATG